MFFEERSCPKHCSCCRRQVYAVLRRHDSWKHFFIAVLTCGLWLPVFLWYAGVGQWQCKRCGSWL